MNKQQTTTSASKNHKKTAIIKFIFPSLLGIILFMFPLSSNGSITIPIAILSKWFQNLLQPIMLEILFFMITLSALGGLYTKLIKPKQILKSPLLKMLFNPSWLWLSLRLIAFFFISIILLVTYQLLPNSILTEMIVSSDTGAMVLNDLLPVLFSIFLFAGLFLPLLLDFGLLEFVGTLLIRIMKPVFGLPGRAAIDCIASWLGDGTIGVLLTSKQYEDGFYTEREAVVIGTNFSLVSITFSLVVINTVDLGAYFVPFYLTVCLASLIAAIIMPKLPPLSRKKDILIDGSKPTSKHKDHTPHNIKYGFELAVSKANTQSFTKCVLIDGSKNVLDMWIGVIPTVMAIGTIALILATYTPLFSILGLPFTPLLKLLGVPEASAAAKTLIAGFADMLLPSVLAASIESDMTRFIVASVSITQLIYLSEVGSLLLSTKIPVKLWELFVIFIERTLITLPIVALFAHLIF